MSPGVTMVQWDPCWRIAPSRFLPVALFERASDPDDLETVVAVEPMTNPRLLDETGEVPLISSEDCVSGPGSSAVMAAFTHPDPEGSRFSDGSWGVFHADCDFVTAVAGPGHHRERFLRDAALPRMELDTRGLTVDLVGEPHDLRGRESDHPLDHHADSDAAGRQLAGVRRRGGSNGIVHDSIHREGGECAAVFRPRLPSNCRQGRHLSHVWDGQRVADVYEKRALQ